jgi:glycosyltransferase involved in cell wall biosynthesis
MRISVITPTHNARHLSEAWASLRQQTYSDWEWVVTVNHESGDDPGKSPTGGEIAMRRIAKEVADLVKGDPRVRIKTFLHDNAGSIGACKRAAFEAGDGEVLVELDHDDILVPEALAEIARAFEEPEIGFVYSDWADFEDDSGGLGSAWPHGPRPPGQEQGQPRTYVHPETRPNWISNGFQFYRANIAGLRAGSYECVSAFSPSALAFSLIYFAPNHVRAWRRTVYQQIGGHSPDFKICDDHELLIRTYLATRVHHIAKPLYLYRYGANTFDKRTEEIRKLTFELHAAHFERLVRRQCFLEGRQAIDLPVRRNMGEEYVNEIGLASWKEWPSTRLDTGSVGAIKINDALAHHADKNGMMAEIYRVLAPGGYLLSLTPSTDGRGAFMDPGHLSYWNEQSFWYWTRAAQAKFLQGAGPHPRFQEIAIPHGLTTFFPSKWHEDNKISYVRANLVALKDGTRLPGEIQV